MGHEIGPIARPARVDFVNALPKTRSGKIMRRVLKARALGMPEGDLSTLEGPAENPDLLWTSVRGVCYSSFVGSIVLMPPGSW